MKKSVLKLFEQIFGKSVLKPPSAILLAESKKSKGIKKYVVKKTISFEDYKACLFSGETSYRSQLMFRSSKHEVRKPEVNKLALSRDDDKRITVNGISSLARGHCRTIKYNLYI